MITFEGIRENFRFLVLETQSFVNAAMEWLREPDPMRLKRLIARDDYIDNLKNTIEKQCYGRLGAVQDGDNVNAVRAVQIMSINLERIADNCISIMGQAGYLDDTALLAQFPCDSGLNLILQGIARINNVFETRDLSAALEICRAEHELDIIYKTEFDRILADMQSGKNIHNLITVLFIIRYLERMGDSLLNIGEALIFSIIGRRIKIHQFEALEHNLAASGVEAALDAMEVRGIHGTRSGCRISRVGGAQAASPGQPDTIFKEGNPQKIRLEKQSLDLWNTQFPGLAPRVLSFHEDAETASFLLEFMPGFTLDEIIISDDDALLSAALGRLQETMAMVWDATRDGTPASVDYVQQIPARMEQILKIYPGFQRGSARIGASAPPATAELIERCAAIQPELAPPFSMLIHGDFNANNIVYNPDLDAIHYIDIYRSRRADYVQDVSVFLISNFRIPVFDHALRRRLNGIIRTMYTFAKQTAAGYDDAHFAPRLALALARSFYTSTRYELNTAFAKEMFLRAHYLFEKITAHKNADKPWREFQLPEQVLYY